MRLGSTQHAHLNTAASLWHLIFHLQCIDIHKLSIHSIAIHHSPACLCKVPSLDQISIRHRNNPGHDNTFDAKMIIGIRLIRIIAAIHILLSIQQIILQRLHFIEEILLLPGMCLLKAEHSPCMNIKRIHNRCNRTVRCQILIRHIKAEIIPDHIIGLIQIAARQILLGQIHRRQMIAIEQNNALFITLIDRINQIPDELILFMNLVHIVFPCTALRLTHIAGHRDFRILQHFFCRIGTMRLHRNSKDVILARSGIHSIIDRPDQIAVTHPPIVINIILILHIFLGRKGIKAKILIHFLARIEICLIVMQGTGRIAKRLQIIGTALARFLGQNALERIFTGAKEAQRHAGQRLKLRIGRAGADGRHRIVAICAAALQLMPVGNGILRALQIIHTRRIKERFQLYHNNIRKIIGIRRCRTCLFILTCNRLYKSRRIVVRLPDPGIQYRYRKAVRKAIILIGKGNIAEVCGKNAGIDAEFCQAEEAGKCGHKTNDHNRIVHLSTIPRRTEEIDHHKDNCRYDKSIEQEYPETGQILAHDCLAFRKVLKIRAGERRYPLGKDNAIGDTKGNPEPKDKHPQKAPLPEQKNRQ